MPIFKRKKSEKKKKKGKDFLNKKTLLTIIVLSGIICYLILSHEFSESWAWEIARSIITIDGIILGFIVVGVTLFFSERGYLKSRLVEDLEKGFEALKKGDKEKFSSIWDAEMDKIISFVALIPVCVGTLSLSIGSALPLFGASESTNATLKFVFSNLLSLSIFSLVLGIYLTYKLIFDFVILASGVEIAKAAKTLLETSSDKADAKK